ncbi:ketopantoate reductase [Glaciihabitans tibetensis]|uniref:2-dehydropantoate 2-reductase n=1 Tax=Glaciihabitans tibetensis TaxID=1266600 RepID=A0A2T0VHF7_9MICO|nr:2-dehydropantoate 2-reductase [Glaciihabitans tibetensis]PRY69648.1 ketopantoate reductase [Glaciihabitans tibetensis]
MRVGVIGAGAVGGALAALLDRAGHSVDVTARGPQLAAIRTGGIRLGGAWGEHTARVTADERLERAPEIAILATKAQDAADAIEANRAMLEHIPLLVVQNGLDGVTTASALLPNNDVVGGLAMFASSYLSPGEITITAAAPLYLGGGSAEHEVPALFLAELLRGVLPVTVLPNFVGAQWTKLVVNQINSLPAITGLSAQQVAADASLLRILTESMRETVMVGVRRSVRFEELQGLSDLRLRLFARVPVALARALPARIVSRMGATPNPGSTLQSIRRGQATEIDYLAGAVVRAGVLVAVPTPVCAAMVHLVHEVERTGVFFSPDEVVRRVRAAVGR